MKRILTVRLQLTNAAVYGELGRVLLTVVRKERILKYWFKIIKSEGSLINKQIANNNNKDAMWADQLRMYAPEFQNIYDLKQ